MKKQEILETVLEKEKKYSALVWFARVNPELFSNKIIRERYEEKIKLYPQETFELLHGDSNWNHAFNSGVLAGMRYILTLDEDGKEQADEEFPFLDT